ncbi:cellulose biosynthesis cyclic di-GMP-binding regulatory protein BcsB, partial [Sutterella wadsworthensis]
EMHYERTYEGGSPENCKSIMVFPHQFEVEPTSTLEISGLYHYARMPNLKLFTQTGYPFTRYADLAETAVLIADNAEPQSIRAMLNAVGRMSAATGAFGNRIAVTGNPADPILKDRDVLLVGAMPALLADINEDDALKVQEETAKAFKAGQFPKPPQQSIFAPGVGVLSGFKSPLSSEHSVVALLAEGEAGAVVLADALGDAQGLAAAGGSTTVVSADGLAAFSVGDRYAVGNLPVQHQIWMRLSQHPGWLVFFALISAAIIGFAAFFLMRRWVGRRA